MNFNQLKCFCQIAESGSFSKAEESLFVSKQALKKQMDSLEKELGFPLFVRNRQGLVLTKAGRNFYSDTCDILKSMDNSISRSRIIASGEQFLRIRVPVLFLSVLSDVITEYSARYPHIRIDVVNQPAVPDTIDDLINNKLDIAEIGYRSELENRNLQYDLIGRKEFSCLMSATHPLAQRAKITPKLLDKMTVGSSAGNIDNLNQVFKESEVSVNWMQLAHDRFQDIYNICWNGGIYISTITDPDRFKPFVLVPLDVGIVKKTMLVYCTKPSMETKLFVNTAREMLKEQIQT